MNEQKEIKTRLIKCLLELVILQFLNEKEMHGYQIIKEIKKEHGVYFGPSTIYPQLNGLEKRKLIRGRWEMHKNRPHKTYQLTTYGRNQLCLSTTVLTQLNLTIDLQKSAPNTEKAVENIPSALA
jgi:PadR family transcriptional regulator PadR